MTDEVFQDKLTIHCDCTLQDHAVEFRIIDLGEDWPEDWKSKEHPDNMYIQISSCLNYPRSFFKRVWLAFRYIIKREPRYSYHFDTTTLTRDSDLNSLISMINKVQRIAEERRAKL